MKRREVLGVIGGAAAWPFAVRAQQKVPVIGFLGTTSPSAWREPIAAFEQRLSELGWIRGRTITIDYRWTEGRNEQALVIAEAFVQRKVDIIVAGGNAVAAKLATTSTPIVFPVAADPLGSGFVASLSRPGGNITGLSQQSPDLAAKRLELLREVSPGLRRLAVLANVGYPAAVGEMNEVQATARAFGLDVVRLEVRRAEDIAPDFEGIKGRADALHICIDALVGTHRNQIAGLALGAGLPTVAGEKGFAEAGALMAYGPSNTDLLRRAGDLVDKILRGAKPDDLPVEQPTKFELVVNLKTAKALGLKISDSFLLRADEVIE